MSITLPLLTLIGMLVVLALLQAHHPGEAREPDRVLLLVVSAQSVAVLVLAGTQVLALARP